MPPILVQPQRIRAPLTDLPALVSARALPVVLLEVATFTELILVTAATAGGGLLLVDRTRNFGLFWPILTSSGYSVANLRTFQ